MGKKKKYAMVGINSRQTNAGTEDVRRVLIRYSSYSDLEFSGTKFIEKDPYFYDLSKSHQYEFYDDGYTLASNDTAHPIAQVYEEELLNKHRPYHYNPFYAQCVGVDSSVVKPILIEADDDSEAIYEFKNREGIEEVQVTPDAVVVIKGVDRDKEAA